MYVDAHVYQGAFPMQIHGGTHMNPLIFIRCPWTLTNVHEHSSRTTMEAPEYPCNLIDSYGYSLTSTRSGMGMKIIGYPWISILTVGACKHPQVSAIHIDRYAWIYENINGCPWMAMDINRECLWSIQEHSPHVSMDIHGDPLISMDVH